MSDDLLDTVSKALALHDEAHHRLVCECVLCDPNTQLRGWLRSLLARCREAETALADLRERDHVLSKHLEDRATARDPLAQSLIAAENAALERAKRAESDLAAARAEAERERIENTHLREAFVTMERAANEREREVERLRERWKNLRGWAEEGYWSDDHERIRERKPLLDRMAALDTPAREGGEGR